MKHIRLVLILLIFTPLVSYSAPTIISYSNGVITGSNFGTKSVAAPIRFETFEINDSDVATTSGNLVSSELSYWTDRGVGQDNPTISVLNNRINSGKNALIALARSIETGDTASMAWHNNVWSSRDKIYVNLWIRFQWCQSMTNSIGYYQIKTASVLNDVLSNGTGITPTGFSLFCYHYDGDDNTFGTSDDYTQWYFRNTGGASTRSFSNNVVPFTESGGWYNLSYQIDQGTASTADGSYKVWLTSSSGDTFNIISEENTLMGTSDDIQSFKFGWYLDDVDSGYVNLHYDNVYLDNSWARVEIGDNVIYDSCTHREIQIPSAWATGEITAELNQGSFTDGSTIYLFVIDSDGTASDGKAITLGATAGTTLSGTGTTTLSGTGSMSFN